MEAIIDGLGTREQSKDVIEKVFNENHLEFVKAYREVDIWVRPFTVEKHGLEFGFVPRNILNDPDLSEDERREWKSDLDEIGDSGWRVEAMPGNTLSFYPPWEAGEYDT